MIIRLVDISRDMIMAWRKEFKGYSDIEIHEKSIFDIEAQALISPANSFGIMDGGLDGKLRDYFGMNIEERVRNKIREEYSGEMPVGCAVTVETGNAKFPFLISAPTMRVPESVSESVNAYLAMRAILLEAIKRKIDTLGIPGLGTLSGRIPYEIAARQMRVAYDKIVSSKIKYSHWREEKELQRYMRMETRELPFDFEIKGFI